MKVLLLISVLAVVVLPSGSYCGMLFPRTFTRLGGQDIQEFTSLHALEHIDKVLYAEPVGGDLIRIDSGTEASFYADAGFDKIVYTLEGVDLYGIRTNRGTWAYGAHGSGSGPGWFDGPRAVAIDHNRQILGDIERWVVYVADAGNGRIAVLNFDYDTVSEEPQLAHVEYWGEGDLIEPYDLDYDEHSGFLYVVDRAADQIVIFGGLGSVVSTFGGTGDGVEEFSSPSALVCDTELGVTPHYVFIADTGNCRMVRLWKPILTQHNLIWLGEYHEIGFYPIGVTAFSGSGVYVLTYSKDGIGIVSFDRDLSQRVGDFGFCQGDGHYFCSPRYIRMRDGEVGITDDYSASTGLSYWVLDAQVVNASATPNPFDPLESWCLISYSVTAHGTVTIEIFDSDWTLVVGLVDSMPTACGYHQELWDGSSCPQGLYHVVLSCLDYGGDGDWDSDTLDVRIDGVPLEQFGYLPSDMPICYPSWSNKGDRIGFAVRGSEYPPEDGIYILDLTDSTWFKVAGTGMYDCYPDWSPNDEYLVFQNSVGPGLYRDPAGFTQPGTGPYSSAPLDVGDSWIYKTRSDGTQAQPTLLTVGGEENDWHPAWSPSLTIEEGDVPLDGGRIAIWCYSDHQLYTFRASDGGDRQMITPGSAEIGGEPLMDKSCPAWSPDGSQIAFHTRPLDRTSIWKIDTETRCFSKACEESSWAALSGISWSPNGSLIAYEIKDSDDLTTGVKTISSGGDFHLGYVVKHDYGYGFDWSPDGTKMVFVKEHLDGRGLAVVDFRRDEGAFPAANIAWPVSGEVLPKQDYLYIWGTAFDNIGVDGQVLSTCQSDILEWGRGKNPGIWATDYLYTLSPKEYGKIGYWDTRTFEEGVVYSLRLTVTDGVNTNTDQVYVTICDSASVGVPTDGVPKDFETAGPFPTPSAGRSTIRLGLPDERCVRASIYSCEGRLVKEILNAGLPAGYHTIEWDGRDARGKPCACGVYWCIVDTGAFSKSMKIVLLK